MRNLIAFVLLWSTAATHGQLVTLSPQAEISIITCGRGPEEVYSAFGHSAIRVSDPVNRINYAYNYGVFDFSQPNFYLNYTRGLLLFKLGVYDYPDFVNAYVYYNRWVSEQILQLSPRQKQDVFDYLEWNALPENETYRYDYFYNNCANKVRDVFAEVLKDSIRFDGSFITTDYTIRQLTDLYLQDQPWGDLGIDICLGLPMDKKAVAYEYMFLPDYLASSFDHATNQINGITVPLVKLKKPVFVNIPRDPPRALVHPWWVMGGFLALTVGLCIIDWKRKKISTWFDLIFFGALGLVGTLLLTLWLATDHQAASKNFNLLWAMPTHLLVFGMIRQRPHPFLKKYFMGVAVVTTLLLVSWNVLPQQLNTLLVPVVASVACRAWMLGRLG
ncbi:MAG: DUF4105 domain-containing protein [Cytophagales bacterium]|nr:DUF4105 domain-containing protein [Cytophagales bacterium]